jgi:hypothetical protein
MTEDLEAWEMEKLTSLQGEQIALTGFDKFSQWYLDTFRVHNRVNVWILFAMMFLYLIVFSLLFKKLLVFIYEKLCGESGVALNKKTVELPTSWWRSVFESLNFLWAVLSIIITMPYSRLTGATTFLCFWSWCTMMFITVPVGLSNNRTLRRFVIKYIFWFSYGVMATANWAYFYYNFYNQQWDYLAIHMGPPLWAFLFVLVNIHEFDDDVNPLQANPFVFSFLITYYLACIATWRHFNIPHIVYSMFHMDNLYFYGTVFPIAVNFGSLFVFCLARVIYVRLNGKQKKE